MQVNQTSARLVLSGTLEFRNAAGEVIKTTEMRGAVPLDDLGITEDEARQLIKEASHGTDVRK